MISVAAAGSRGAQAGNLLVINYAVGTTDSIDQSYSDWASPSYISSTNSGGLIGPASFNYSQYPVNSATPVVGQMTYPGEWIIAKQDYRDRMNGARDETSVYVYGY